MLYFGTNSFRKEFLNISTISPLENNLTGHFNASNLDGIEIILWRHQPFEGIFYLCSSEQLVFFWWIFASRNNQLDLTNTNSTETCVKVFLIIHVGGGTAVEGDLTMEPILAPLWTIFWVLEIHLSDLPDTSCLGVLCFLMFWFSGYFVSSGVFGQTLKVKNLNIWICQSKKVAKFAFVTRWWMDSFLLDVFEHLKLEAVLEVILFFFVIIVTRVQPFLLVKLHVLRPVACYYSKTLGEVASQFPRSMTMWFWPSKMSQTDPKWLLWHCRGLLPKWSKISSFTQINRPFCQWTVFLLPVHSFLDHSKYYHITVPPHKAMRLFLNWQQRGTWHRIIGYSWPRQILSEAFLKYARLGRKASWWQVMKSTFSLRNQHSFRFGSSGGHAKSS